MTNDDGPRGSSKKSKHTAAGRIAQRARSLLGLTSLAALAACSLVVGANRDQCVTNEDCTGKGLSSNAICRDEVCTVPSTPTTDAQADREDVTDDPVWGCLGKVPPLPAADKSAPVPIVASFWSAREARPLAALSIKACTAVDVGCAAPLEGTPKDTNEDGTVDLLLHSGFRGYLDVGKAAHPALMPSLAYVQPIPDKSRDAGNAADGGGRDTPYATRLLDRVDLEYYAALANVALSETSGHLIYTAVDCQGNPAVDTILTIETVTTETMEFYIDGDGNPSVVQKKTGPSGVGGYLNLPGGSVGTTLRRLDQTKIASQNVVVRKGTITFTRFEPSP